MFKLKTSPASHSSYTAQSAAPGTVKCLLRCKSLANLFHTRNLFKQKSKDPHWLYTDANALHTRTVPSYTMHRLQSHAEEQCIIARKNTKKTPKRVLAVAATLTKTIR